MKLLWKPRSLRARLTLWYVGAMVGTLALYAGTVYAFVSSSASNALNARLRADFRWASEMLEQAPDGTLVWFNGDDGNTEQDSPWLQVWSPEGGKLVQSMFAERHPIPESSRLAFQAPGKVQSIPVGRDTFRLLTDRSVVGGRPVIVQVATSESTRRQVQWDLLIILLLGLPIGAAVAGIGGHSLARRALAPVDGMADRARYITAERLSERLPIDNPSDELGRLASVFNDTLGRLESSFDQMRRFTADISHELRTPLTAIRSVGEVGLRGARTGRAYRGIIGSMLEEVDRLAGLVDRVLTLSRAETGQAKLSLEEIDLHELASEVVAHLSVLAEEKRQSISVVHVGSPHSVGDRMMLRQALINLVDNAIKYTPSGGQIHVRVSATDSEAIIDVSDTGPGIASDRPNRVFDRFYRDHQPVSEEVAGTGLGLAIAKWGVEVSGGRLTLEESRGVGSTFRIALPAVQIARARRAAIA